MTLGEKLRQARKRRGMTLQEVEERTGVNYALLSMIERGKRNPTLHVLEKLAKGLRVTITFGPRGVAVKGVRR